eukprot:TRINITY_DN37468_c0_g1_i1.p1 TRINITY_DN37468_c0_g1~~TRINITY_DN37468_c0_g1_i1.p1  ORF type:complete len:352 (+),score=20.14 TRINITY_DN37468_c0_g1_i1:54-1058(+)
MRRVLFIIFALVVGSRIGTYTRPPTAPTSLKSTLSKTTLPRCKEMADLYPGKLVGSKWKPDNCRLKDFSWEEKGRCVGEKKLFTISDSLGEAVQRRVFYDFLFARRWSRSIREKYAPAGKRFIWSPSTASRPLLHGKFLPSLRKSSFVILSNGLWDIGMGSCGIDHYFDVLRKKVLIYKRTLRSGSTMVLYNIPYIHHKTTGSKLGTLCNPGPRVAVYREALKLVASCTGVGILDTFQMQKQNANSTPDGIHSTGKGNVARAGIIYSMMCPSKQEDRLQPYHPGWKCTPEAVKEAKARWASVPEAASQPEGCPSLPVTKRKCFKSADLLKLKVS